MRDAQPYFTDEIRMYIRQAIAEADSNEVFIVGRLDGEGNRITSYNVCYTKLLRCFRRMFSERHG